MDTASPRPQPAAAPPAGDLRPVRVGLRFATLRTILALVIRDLSTANSRLPGGFLWSILEPVAGIILLVVVIRGSFREPPLGTNFGIFYATGMLPFYLFTNIQNRMASAIQASRALLSYPRVTLFDALAARFIVSAVTQVLFSYIVFSVILAMGNTRVVIDLPRILLAYSMATAIGLGFGLLNCYLWSVHAVWRSFWGFISRPLVLISGVIILPDVIPQPYRGWLMWNPLMHVTGEMHGAFYPGYRTDFVDPVYVFSLALIAGTFGLLMLRRYYRDLLEL